jgi:hypothetical protein
MIYDRLSKLAYKYGSDKCPQIKHTYTPFYYGLLNNKRKLVKKVLEVGIGCHKTMEHVAVIFDRGEKRSYQKGASLKMWRDFFPNAQVYGADIEPEAIFIDERINTFRCDTRYKPNIEDLIKLTGADIDLFIDDGSHDWRDQIFLAKAALPLLKKDIIYIIEDVGYTQLVIDGLREYKCSVPKLTHPKKPQQNGTNNLILVENN